MMFYLCIAKRKIMEFRTLNPATEKLEKTYPFISDKELWKKVEAGEEAFDEWRKLSTAERKPYFQALAQELEAEKDFHGRTITREMGKPLKQAIGEIEKCAWVCRHYAENAESFLESVHKDFDDKTGIIRFEPLGIIYAIMPWNFPYWQFFRYAAPALMAGNVTLLKHAPNVPQCTLNIEEVFQKAGFPANVFQHLFIDYAQSDKLIGHSAIQGITLTGSTGAGSHVAAHAGKHIKKTVLELGGSDPFLVLADAHVEEAAKTAAWARMQNTGQSCIASKRFLVHDAVKDQFLETFKQEIVRYKQGDPENEETQLGPLARKDLVDQLDQQVRESVEKGAKVLTGGKVVEGPGYYYEPTILTDVGKGMPAYNEELFGPVATVFTFSDEQEAINLANDTPYGLGASVWSASVERAKTLSWEIQTGNISINGMVKSDPRLPFGGVKASGYGRELSEFGIKEFVNIKTLNVF